MDLDVENLDLDVEHFNLDIEDLELGVENHERVFGVVGILLGMVGTSISSCRHPRNFVFLQCQNPSLP